jgi:transposase
MKEQKAQIKGTRPTHYSDEFKHGIIEEYLATGVSKCQIQRKYGLRRHSTIHSWMQMLGYSDSPEKDCKLESINQRCLTKKSGSKSASAPELEAKIKLLERQLEDERLKSEFYNRMIDLAERTYKIPVRKNSDTK